MERLVHLYAPIIKERAYARPSRFLQKTASSFLQSIHNHILNEIRKNMCGPILGEIPILAEKTHDISIN